jgi:hypothetical protein
MQRQHIENLFRRFKGQVVNVKTVSGGIYEGKVTEITNDYLCLVRTDDPDGAGLYILFGAIESVTVRAGSPL